MFEDIFNVVTARFNGANEEKKDQKLEIPPDVFIKCSHCGKVTTREELDNNIGVCPSCGYHTRISARNRLKITVDKGSFVEYDADMTSCNPIDFPGYEAKQEKLREKTGLKDAIVTGECTIRGHRCVIGIMDTSYMMASMGSVVGEKITRAFETAAEKGLPVIMFTASGGARMQEGIISLMQMAKTSGAVAKHSEKGLLYITVMTDPTTGGVTASFASLGDIIIAEPKIVIGFAGRRVIEGTIKQKLPDDFQSSEFLLQHGFVDMVVERRYVRRTIGHLLNLHGYPKEEVPANG